MMLIKGKILTRRILALMLLWGFLSWPSVGQLSIPLDNEDAMFAEGMELYNTGVYGYAQDRFAAYLDIKPQDRNEDWQSKALAASVHQALCGLWLEQDQAEHELVQLINEHRPDPVVYLAAKEVGNSYYNNKRYREAISYYEMIDLNNVDQEMKSEVAFKQGYCHFVRKKFDLAENYLTQAAAFRTIYYYPANYYLGMTSFFDADYEKSASYFEKVGPSKKYKTYVPYYLTQIYFNQGNYQQVVEYGERQLTTLELDKEAEIKNLIGRSYFELGDEKKALTYLREFEASNVKFTAADHYQVGYLSYKDGSYDDAIVHLKEIAAIDDATGHQANYYLGHTYIKKGNKEAARSAFANVKRKTDSPELKDEATYNYGLLSAELNHDREAVNALMEIQSSSQYYTVAQEALAKLFLRTNDYDNAIKILEELDKSNPTLKEAYQRVTYYKGKQLFAAGKAKPALDYFTQSLAYPADPTIEIETLFAKGSALNALDKYSESNSVLNQFSSRNATSKSDSRYLAPYIQGYNYLKLNNYPSASTGFAKTVSSIDRDRATLSSGYIRDNVLSDALVRLGDCAFHANDYITAQKNYQRSYKMKKNDFVYAYFQTGLIYGLQGDPIQKIVILEDLQKNYSKSPFADDALLEAGRTYLTLGKYDAAATPLLLLTKNYKNSDLITPSYLTLGLISYNKGATDQAIKFYKKVFSHNPSAAERNDALNALQEIYINDVKDPDEYVAFLKSVSGGKIEDTVRDSLNYKSAYHSYVNGQYPEASQQFSRYITNFPEGLYDIEAHYFRGECAALEKDYSNAYRDYVYVVEQGNSRYYEKSLRKAALIAYNELNNFEKSYAFFNTLAELNISDAAKSEAYVGALRSAHRIGNKEETIRLADIVRNFQAASPQDKLAADYYQAKIFFEDGRYDEALPPLNRISKQSEDEFASEARYLIAQVYTKRNELKIAEEMARLAIKENANYPSWVARSIILLSDILVAQGDTFNAKAALEAVIENFTEDAGIVSEARNKLAQLKNNEVKENNLLKNSKSELLQLDEN